MDQIAKWERHFKGWKESGLSQPQYCRKHRLNHHSFTYWRTKIGAMKKEEAAGSFIPVGTPSSDEQLEIILSDRLTIRVPRGFDASELKRLIEAVS